jgi:predicted ATPase
MAGTTASHRSLLPVPRSRLIGRAEEIAAARAFLLDEAVPLLTLTGSGGVGKTRLALAVASDVTSAFADGVLWVDLAPLAVPELVIPTVASALGTMHRANQPILDAVTVHLQPRQSLLLLDNCEHLLAPVAALVSTLLKCCPALQVLATSRAPLQVSGEQMLPVPPLRVPEPEDAIPVVRVAPSVDLFAQRARTVDPAFALTEHNAEAVAAVCRQLDGLPLAIELAAARSHLLSPASLLALLDRRLSALGSGPRDAPARQQTIHNAIAWSHDLLSREEQALFRHLAVFTGGWTLEAAAAIGELSVADVLDRLGTLVHQSLVIRRADCGALSPRFAMLETIREFGLERLRESGDDDDVRDRHAEFFRRLVANLDLYYAFPGDPSWFDCIAPEEANLRQALERFLERGDARGLSELSSGLNSFWLTRLQFSEGSRWLHLAIAGDRDLPADLRARSREAAGIFIANHGEFAIAAAILEEALALARYCADPALLRNVFQSLGFVARWQGDYARAMALHEEEERMARIVLPSASHAGLYLGAALCFQGVTAQRSGDNTTAVARFREAESYLRAPGGSRRLGMMLGELGVIHAIAGHPQEALQPLVEGLARTWGARDDATLPRTLRGLAGVAAVTGQSAAAARLLGAADAIDLRTPFGALATRRDRDLVAWCLAQLDDAHDAMTLDREPQVEASLTVVGAVALACDVAASVLGVERVTEIWRATGAPCPEFSLASPVELPPAAEPVIARADLTFREQDVLRLLPAPDGRRDRPAALH